MMTNYTHICSVLVRTKQYESWSNEKMYLLQKMCVNAVELKLQSMAENEMKT